MVNGGTLHEESVKVTPPRKKDKPARKPGAKKGGKVAKRG